MLADVLCGFLGRIPFPFPAPLSGPWWLGIFHRCAARVWCRPPDDTSTGKGGKGKGNRRRVGWWHTTYDDTAWEDNPIKRGHGHGDEGMWALRGGNCCDCSVPAHTFWRVGPFEAPDARPWPVQNHPSGHPVRGHHEFTSSVANEHTLTSLCVY